MIVESTNGQIKIASTKPPGYYDIIIKGFLPD
jgi:hypothetical protein